MNEQYISYHTHNNMNSASGSQNPRDHVSYSIHSIHVKKSLDENRFPINRQVYNEMIKEQESNESHSDKVTVNLPLLNDLKSSSNSMASYSSNSQKFYLIGDHGHLSPIVPKINTDINSNTTDNEELGRQFQNSQLGNLPSYVQYGSNSMMKQGSYRSSADNYEIYNEMRKHGGMNFAKSNTKFSENIQGMQPFNM